MRVDDQRIGALDALPHPSALRAGSSPSPPWPHRRAARGRAPSRRRAIASSGSSAVDVVVPVVATTAHGRRPLQDVVLDHRPRAIQAASRTTPSCGTMRTCGLAESGEQRRLLDRAVAVRRGVDDERLRFAPAARRARGCNCDARSRAHSSATSVLVDAVSLITPLHASDRPSIWRIQPVDDLFDFGERRARLPRQPDHAKAGADVIAEHAREQRVRREVAEEPRMLPRGDAGHHDAIEVADDGVEGFRLLRRRCGQLRLDLARRGLAPSPGATRRRRGNPRSSR